MNHQKIFFPLVLLLLSLRVMAQSDSGHIEVIKDHRLDKMLQMYKDEQSNDPVVPGYRIQIFSDNNRPEVQKNRDSFAAQFPTLKPYIVYQAPNFKLRIGNYRSRLEAYKDLLDVSKVFGNAFIVKTDINIADL